MNNQILEERLINFSVMIIELVNTIPSSKAATHICGQLLRSGTSPALNYGEAQSAESQNDFIHKLQVVLKELRESFVGLKILRKANLYENKSRLELSIKECNELISIFVKSVQTAKKRRKQY